jgi:hypothetical protein
VFGVQGMKARRGVLTPEHLDNDAEELADRGHYLTATAPFQRSARDVVLSAGAQISQG